MKKVLVSFLPILLYNKYVLAAQRGIPLQVSILKIYFWVQIQRSHYTYCINATCVKYLVPIFLFKWHFFEILFYFFEIPTIINVCERGNPAENGEGKFKYLNLPLRIFKNFLSFFALFYKSFVKKEIILKTQKFFLGDFFIQWICGAVKQRLPPQSQIKS